MKTLLDWTVPILFSIGHLILFLVIPSLAAYLTWSLLFGVMCR